MVLEAKAMPSRLTMLLDNESLIWLGPSTITSVLSEFNNKKLDFQFLMSIRHVWRSANHAMKTVMESVKALLHAMIKK